MNRLIKNTAITLIVACTSYMQPAFASDNSLNDYVYKHLENWDTEFEIPYYNNDVISVVHNIAKQDDYLSRSISQLYYCRSEKKAIIKVTYRTTKEQEEYIDGELKKIVNSIITDGMSDYDKVKAINQYLADRYQYDDSLQSDNVYSALTTGKTICQGYAMSAYKMLNLAGVQNRIIIGNLDGIAHGWNLVKVNGKWYHLDITNDDAVGIVKYFLKSDDYFKKEGFSWNASDYVACNENYDGVSDSNNTKQASVNKITSSNKQPSNNGYKSNVDGKWSLLKNIWYFVKNDGNYATGWKVIDNNWYYLSDNGAMKTGWINYSGKWYYCYPSTGVMAVNTTINGYKIDNNGVWIA